MSPQSRFRRSKSHHCRLRHNPGDGKQESRRWRVTDTGSPASTHVPSYSAQASRRGKNPHCSRSQMLRGPRSSRWLPRGAEAVRHTCSARRRTGNRMRSHSRGRRGLPCTQEYSAQCDPTVPWSIPAICANNTHSCAAPLAMRQQPAALCHSPRLRLPRVAPHR